MIRFSIVEYSVGSSSGRRRPLIAPLVVLDPNVRKRDGSEVLAYIRRSPGFRYIAVVVLSSSPERVMRERAAHTDSYTTKPNESNEFLRIGGQILDCVEAVRANHMSAALEIGKLDNSRIP